MESTADTAAGPPADAELRRRLVYGDESALGEAYAAYGALVRRVARRVTRSPAAAEDVAQEVFAQLWSRPYAFDARRGSLRTWLSGGHGSRGRRTGAGGFAGLAVEPGCRHSTARVLPPHGRTRAVPGGGHRTGVKSRAPMNSGRRTGAENGSTAVFSTLLNTMNTLLRGKGVMLSPEPCRQLQSNQVAEPARPVKSRMPCRSANLVSASSEGVPASCIWSDFL